VVVNSRLELTAETHVHFDSMLPEYRTVGGVHVAGRTVTAPTGMWVKGLDMLLDKLRVAGLEFSTVGGVSGAGQQHGSVYWRRGADALLAGLRPDRFLHDQLGAAFSVQDSPVWMDSSTGPQCRMLEAAVGGAKHLAELTGSRAYERFTGSQIAKLATERPEVYLATERISLVSSLAASLFAGKVVGVDWADAGGTNLLDLRTRAWHPELLAATAEGLAEKLGSPVSPVSVVGSVSEYMQER
jgi:xylulokinase